MREETNRKTEQSQTFCREKKKERKRERERRKIHLVTDGLMNVRLIGNERENIVIIIQSLRFTFEFE